jgi:hypothetical protein
MRRGRCALAFQVSDFIADARSQTGQFLRAFQQILAPIAGHQTQVKHLERLQSRCALGAAFFEVLEEFLTASSLPNSVSCSGRRSHAARMSNEYHSTKQLDNFLFAWKLN